MDQEKVSKFAYKIGPYIFGLLQMNIQISKKNWWENFTTKKYSMFVYQYFQPESTRQTRKSNSCWGEIWIWHKQKKPHFREALPFGISEG